jgi:hypothetical protein
MLYFQISVCSHRLIEYFCVNHDFNDASKYKENSCISKIYSHLVPLQFRLEQVVENTTFLCSLRVAVPQGLGIAAPGAVVGHSGKDVPQPPDVLHSTSYTTV